MQVLTAFVLSTLALGGTPSGELLDFTAPWCGPCQQMGPIVDRLHRQGYPVRKVDFDTNRQLARQYNIDTIPAFVLVIDGKVVERSVGLQSEQNLLRMVARIPKPKPEFAPQRQDQSSLAGAGQPGSAAVAPNWKPAPKPANKGFNLNIFNRKSPSEQDLAQAGKTDNSQVRGNMDSDDRPINLNAVRAKEPLQASIRIRITDEGGTNVGSGTIIESKVGHTLILTCGHIFRDFQQNSLVEVDIFTNGKKETIVGKHLRHDLKLDLGLISISTDNPLPFAPVVGEETQLAQKDGVVSVGCGQGSQPTLLKHVITHTHRYKGPSNIIECTGTPIQGRSGGGLFNKRGEVVGVCMAADEQGHRGLYVGPQAIRGFLNSDRPAQEQPAESAPEIEDQSEEMLAEFEEEQPELKGVAALQAALGEDAGGVICVVKSTKLSAGQKVVVLSSRQPADSVASLKGSLQSGRTRPTSLAK